MKRLKTILCILLSSMFLLLSGCVNRTETSFSAEDSRFRITLELEKNEFENKYSNDTIKGSLCIKVKRSVKLKNGFSPYEGFIVRAIRPTEEFRHYLDMSYPQFSLDIEWKNPWTLKRGESFKTEFILYAPSFYEPQADYRVYITVHPAYAELMHGLWLEKPSKFGFHYEEEGFRVIDTGITINVV